MFTINQLQNHSMFIYQISLLLLLKVHEDKHSHEASSPAVGRVMTTIYFGIFPLFPIMVHFSTSEILALWKPNLKSSAQAKSIPVQWLGEDIKDENQNIISPNKVLDVRQPDRWKRCKTQAAHYLTLHFYAWALNTACVVLSCISSVLDWKTKKAPYLHWDLCICTTHREQVQYSP